MAATDAAIGHALQKSFKGLVSKASFNITLNLDTNKVRGFLFRARASLVWPRVTAPTEGTFPLPGCRRPREMSPRLIPTHEVRKIL